MTDLTLPSERRCKDGDICMSDAMPFGQHHEVRTTYPIDECLHPRYFLNVRGRFRAGDRINMVRHLNDGWERVIGGMEGIRVIAVDNLGVELFQTFPAWNLNEPGETGIAVKRGYRGKFTVSFDGATHREFNTLVEANEFAERYGAEKNIVPQLLTYGKQAA